MKSPLLFEVAGSPERVLARVAAAINQRPKRALGVLKTQNEYVGLIRREEFEVWERSQRAVHAVGRVEGSPERTRVEVRLVVPPTTTALLVIFFGLYVVVAVGIALQGPETAISLGELAVAGAGAAALAVFFADAARRQGSDLRSFLAGILGDPSPPETLRSELGGPTEDRR
jgi:hypothetical protein